MPVYEYRCNTCHRKVSLLVRGFSEVPAAVCSNCGSRDLTRLFSTFACLRTDKDVYDDILSDSQLVNRMMANDPGALVEWSRRLEGSEGEKSSEYGEALERMEKGESPDQIMRDMQQKELGTPEGAGSEEE